MGTLTGTAPCLEGHCLHKLPTSCRLTATLDCCACQDRRPHAPTYQTYVDGVGMVARGTRWQRYCWFCKEFWENRVRLEGFEPRSTRVPDVPDQASFCGKWHDYHRGYRINDPDPSSLDHKAPTPPERPWQDVAPGFLPTWDQPDVASAAQRQPPREQAQAYVSLDETLDDLLDSAEADAPNPRARREEDDQRRQAAATATVARTNTRNALPSAEQIQEARARLSEAEDRRRGIASELAAVDSDLRAARQRHTQLMQAQATARNMERVFGTREDFLREGNGYVSPLTSMFTRAYDRYRTAEEVRAAERLSTANNLLQEEFAASIDGSQILRDVLNRSRHETPQDEPAARGPQSLDDERIVRPPPKSDEEMRVSLACRICLQQVADTATLPCGHLVMCSFCATIAVPTKDEAQTQPARRNAACPQCRRQVKRLARIYTA